MRARRRWVVAFLAFAIAAIAAIDAAPTSSAAEQRDVNLKVVGHPALGEVGPLVAVATTGTAAVVVSNGPGGGSALGSDCAAPLMTLVDVKNPRRPKVASQIPLAPGGEAISVNAVAAPDTAVSKALVAVAVGPGAACPGAAGFVGYYDVSTPAAPRLLGRTTPCGDCPSRPTSVSLAQRRDGRVVSLILWSPTDARTDGAVVQLDDVTDAANPDTLAQWSPPTVSGTTAICGAPVPAVDAELHDEARRALVVLEDGRLYDLDVRQPGPPITLGEFPPPPDGRRSAFATALPIRHQTLAIVSEVGAFPGCTTGPRGLRIVDLDQGAPDHEVAQATYGGDGTPDKVVASGESAFAPWREGGLRVLDLGETHPRPIAQFTPRGTVDVVGVGLLPNDIVALDRSSGLYILERPKEGATESLWEKTKTMVAALVLVGAISLVAIPRLLMAWSLARRRAGTRVPSPVRSRQR